MYDADESDPPIYYIAAHDVDKRNGSVEFASTYFNIKPADEIQSSSSSEMSTSTKIALGVGVGVGVPMLAFALVMGFWWKRKSSNKKSAPRLILDDSDETPTKVESIEKPVGSENMNQSRYVNDHAAAANRTAPHP